MDEKMQVIIDAVETFGKDNTVDKFVEEMGEMIQAVMKYQQGEGSYRYMAEEMADLSITFCKMLYMLSVEKKGFLDEYRMQKEYKLQYLKDLL